MDNSQEPVGNSNPPVDRRRSIGRPKSSWIWKYFDSEIRDDYKWAICKLDKLGTDIPCKKEYKTGGSTKNCIDHLLNKHNLCSDGSKDDQQTITVKIINKHQEARQLELRQYLQAERLEDVQRDINENEIKKTDKYLRTIQDCETRWNSSYLAWKRLLALRNAINILNIRLGQETDKNSIKDSKQLKEILITTEEWDLLGSLVDVLEQFAEATDYLGGSTYCTYSIINPFIEQIKADLIETSSSDSLQSLPQSPLSHYPTQIINQEINDDDVFADEDLEIQNDLNLSVNQTDDLLNLVKTRLHENLCKYWNFQDPNALLASLLDPRTKNLDNIPAQVRTETIALLHDKLKELKLNHESIPSDSTSSSSSSSNKYKNSIFTRFQKSKSRPKNLDNEILEYLKIDEIDWEDDPFIWWRREEKHFHYLSILARKYLPIPAASTASERMFSDAGNLMGPKRTRMNPELFNRIIFLKRNSKMLPSIHPPVSNSANV
ncbi:unnamed protein product [Rhizophagus irregularis]|nr:unnamed protein product [Rhizophagus irregularis]